MKKKKEKKQPQKENKSADAAGVYGMTQLLTSRNYRATLLCFLRSPYSQKSLIMSFFLLCFCFQTTPKGNM